MKHFSFQYTMSITHTAATKTIESMLIMFISSWTEKRENILMKKISYFYYVPSGIGCYENRSIIEFIHMYVTYQWDGLNILYMDGK